MTLQGCIGLKKRGTLKAGIVKIVCCEVALLTVAHFFNLALIRLDVPPEIASRVAHFFVVG